MITAKETPIEMAIFLINVFESSTIIVIEN